MAGVVLSPASPCVSVGGHSRAGRTAACAQQALRWCQHFTSPGSLARSHLLPHGIRMVCKMNRTEVMLYASEASSQTLLCFYFGLLALEEASCRPLRTHVETSGRPSR